MKTKRMSAHFGLRHFCRCAVPLCRRRGLTLVELFVAMLIGLTVLGTATVILWQGLSITDSNSAYSLALRGAACSFEFLPKAVGYADTVEIMDAKHIVRDEALRDEGWHYIVLGGDRLREVFWDGERRELPLAGSEYLTSVDFMVATASPDLNGRLLKVVLHAKKSEGLASGREIELQRSLMIRASGGLTGERGPVLRYLPDPLPEPDLNLYSGDMHGASASFSRGNAVTWDKVDYDDYLGLEGQLAFLKGRVEDEVEFKWILCDASLIDSPVQPVGKDPLSLKKFFESDRIGLDVPTASRGDSVLKEAIRVLDVASVREEADGAFTVDWKVPTEPEEVMGKYAILAAVYTPKGRTVRDYWPVLVKIGDIQSDPLFQRISDTFRARSVGGQGEYSDPANSDKNLIRVSEGWGEEIYDSGANESRGSITLLGQNPGSPTATMKVANVLTPEYFKHMDTSIYGVTNYALYLDAALASGVSGGYGILLNGSVSQTANASGVFDATGYVFQVDPGLNGFTVRYFAKNKTLATPQEHFGTRTVYFYDSQRGFPSPKNIFSAGVPGGEDFSRNEGAPAGTDIFHRLPYNVRSGANDRGVEKYLTALIPSRLTDAAHPKDALVYGTPSTTNGLALYMPKWLQTWNGGSSPSAGEYPHSRGFRWDGIWNIDINNAQNRENWFQRHILKLTVLEVTRDVPASQLAPEEWKAASEGGHKAGDMIVRAELIVMKDPTKSVYDSRNYVYSKPMWFGRFRGDSWRGDEDSVFKKTGNTMMHEVASPEPARGDRQSFRRRGMRTRSWLETVDSLHPDYEKGDRKIWTPPVAVDLNRGDTVQNQGHLFATSTFPDYGDPANPVVPKDGSGRYTGEYQKMAYGRLSVLTWDDNSRPLYGLYALRGWDYGFNGSTADVGSGTAVPTLKRFLTIQQGTQLAYAKTGSGVPAYKKNRERSFGLRSWAASGTQNVGLTLYDAWIGEGFSVEEIRDLLGLDPRQFPTDESVGRLLEIQ